jgi:hypothetical protein
MIVIATSLVANATSSLSLSFRRSSLVVTSRMIPSAVVSAIRIYDWKIRSQPAPDLRLVAGVNRTEAAFQKRLLRFDRPTLYDCQHNGQEDERP